MNEQNNLQSNESVQSSKNILVVIIAAVITALIVGGAVYVWQKSVIKSIEQSLQQQIISLQNQIKQLQQKQLSQEGGAGGSGLIELPPTSKYCEDRKAPKEKIFGKTLTISSDKKKILLNNKVAVSISDLPTTVKVSADSSFSVTNEKFTSAVLSPTESVIAFTVSGGTHEWGGFKNVFSGLVYPVAFQFEGDILSPKWNHNGRYVAFSKTTPEPATILTLVNAQELKTYTSEYEKILSFKDINPLPSGIFSNLRNYYWSEDEDSKLYFLVALMDSAVNNEHAELWSVNADTLKWNFYCTSY